MPDRKVRESTVAQAAVIAATEARTPCAQVTQPGICYIAILLAPFLLA